MKNSFKIFTVIAGLLVVLIILRLNSISYPKDIEDNIEVVYLEAFYGYGGLFDIEYRKNRFFLSPQTGNIQLNGNSTSRTTPIEDNVLITVEDRKFLFNVLPRTTSFREVYRRPLVEVFLNDRDTKFIGGWLTTNRQQLLAADREHNRKTLKKMLVEISAEELNKTGLDKQTYDGRLLALQKFKKRDNEGKNSSEIADVHDPSRVIEVKSLHLPIILIRNWKEEKKKPHTLLIIKDGDIIKIPYRNSKKKGDALFIKFHIADFMGMPYLSMSYKEEKPAVKTQEPGQEIAFLRSMDTGMVYSINKNKKNAFIGSDGLFSFTLAPARLVSKLYVPNSIPEGGIVDLKELLDRNMYYREKERYYPVTIEFLQKLKKDLKKKNQTGIRRYFEKNRITWRDIRSYSQLKRFAAAAASLIRKMENKGIYQVFTHEIEKLNHKHHIFGIGLGLDEDRQAIEKVTYRIAGQSWVNAQRIWDNTPIISGIDSYFWGSMIKETDESVQFRIRFRNPPSSIRLIAAADYGYSFGNKKYSRKNFFDGVQTAEFPKGNNDLFIKVWNVKRFNKKITTTNFQAEMVLGNPEGTSLVFRSDDQWEASINGVHWTAARVNPPYSLPDPNAGKLQSIWYYEMWNPVYRGIKFRYFRRQFELEEIPQSMRWRIYASGDYMLRVNRKPVHTSEDFKDALKKGKNTITVMVSRKGFRKRFAANPMFNVQDNRVMLIQKQVHRTSFREVASLPKALILDKTGTTLAWSSTINGKPQRFYTPPAQSELLSFFGSPDHGIWGLEQVFSRLYRENRIASIQLSINHQWQTIVLAAMKRMLHANRVKELKNPRYIKLTRDLKTTEAQLRQERTQLSLTGPSIRYPIMQAVIQLQDEVDKIREKINKIKNPFYEAAVILISSKGEILTAASYPYDEETMKELNPHISQPYRPVENPYLNRSWKWKYNPGSTIKVLDAAAFLYSKNLKDERGNYRFPYLRRLLTSAGSFKDFPRYDLKGSTMLNGKEIDFHLRNFHRYTMPNGFCSLKKAFAHSHNTYFSFLALHNHRVLTHDSMVYDSSEREVYKKYFITKGNIPITRTYWEFPLLEFAEKLLMNQGIDLLQNLKDTAIASGMVRMPTDCFMAAASRFPVNNYKSADAAHYSIGQGDLQVTALQNAMMVSTVLNRGILFHPSLIKSVTLRNGNQEGKTLTFDPDKSRSQVFSAAIAQQVKEAMREVVNSGTADELFKALKKGCRFYAKTGTAETESYQDHSLFTGFVTFKDGTPLVFSVIVPRSGIGAKVAGKLTEDILKAIIDHENKEGKKI
jgi:cell division protein FtsI/penicillin-binding protein 2